MSKRFRDYLVGLSPTGKRYCLAKLGEFSERAHRGQCRKYTFEPYFSHCISVAEKVIGCGGTFEMVCASLLHDVVEDTSINSEELLLFLLGIKPLPQKMAFKIHSVVFELTDVYTKENFPELSRAVRKQKEAGRMFFASEEAKIIKRCDLEDNEGSIKEHDPNFYPVFLKEKDHILKCVANIPHQKEK